MSALIARFSLTMPCYEFVVLDRPLTAKQIAEREISMRGAPNALLKRVP